MAGEVDRADLAALGRQHKGAHGRRRGRRGRPTRRGVIVLLVAALVSFAAMAGDGDDPATDPVDGDATSAEPAGTQAVAVDEQPVPEDVGPALLGTVGAVQLFVPALDPVLVSFHEASLPEALPISPLGPLTLNENTTKFTAPNGLSDASEYHVQVSRGRRQAATSAVDVVIAEGGEVLAPVVGVVREVRSYALYGVYDDVRLELVPDAAPDHVVVLIHMVDVAVAAGDRVEVGDVLAGGARMFPFSAVVDAQTEPERHGHVHLEVKLREP